MRLKDRCTEADVMECYHIGWSKIIHELTLLEIGTPFLVNQQQMNGQVGSGMMDAIIYSCVHPWSVDLKAPVFQKRLRIIFSDRFQKQAQAPSILSDDQEECIWLSYIYIFMYMCIIIYSLGFKYIYVRVHNYNLKKNRDIPGSAQLLIHFGADFDTAVEIRNLNNITAFVIALDSCIEKMCVRIQNKFSVGVSALEKYMGDTEFDIQHSKRRYELVFNVILNHVEDLGRYVSVHDPLLALLAAVEFFFFYFFKKYFYVCVHKYILI
ncbi:MAG: hypothetical protein GY714_32455 [Desulfobacterales bacterium]|nr:hypothetical protein [Desulfobacterales bacterium]